MEGQVASFREVEDLVFKFETVLRKHGIVIQPNSQLDTACLAVIDSVFKHEKPETREEMADIRPALAYALGLWEFMKKIVRLEKHPDFEQLVPHLEQMNDGGFLQNIKAGDRELTDQVPAKMFELLIAMAAMDVGTDLRLDHPKNPKGDNPDVIVTIRGVRWAFACKMMMGKSPISLFERIQDGVGQIDRVAAPSGLVQRGVVVISLKNKLDLDEFWPILNAEQYKNGEPPIFLAQRDATVVASRLAELAEKQMKEMETVNTLEKVVELFRSSIAAPAVLLFMQATMSLDTPIGPLPSVYPLLWPHLYPGCTEEDVSVFNSMYDALHNRSAGGTKPSP